MAPGRLRGSVPPRTEPNNRCPWECPTSPSPISATTPDPGPGWSNLHIFMQTCGVQRGTVRLARTRRACPSPYHGTRSRPAAPSPCDGSRVAPFLAEALRRARPEEGQGGPARELADRFLLVDFLRETASGRRMRATQKWARAVGAAGPVAPRVRGSRRAWQPTESDGCLPRQTGPLPRSRGIATQTERSRNGYSNSTHRRF